jgi:transcriptional regulator with XRE-family HTH domain
MTERSLGEAIATQIRKHRLRKGWSVRRLAEECERLGMPTLTEASLGNIERGQREDAKRTQRRVLVEELAVLARALGVPPVLLMLPLGSEPTVQPTPGFSASTWDVAKWWAGDIMSIEPGPQWGSFDIDELQPVAIPPFYREHDERVGDVYRARRASIDVERDSAVPLKRLRDLRRSMTNAGVLPPELPDDLAGEVKEDGDG